MPMPDKSVRRGSWLSLFFRVIRTTARTMSPTPPVWDGVHPLAQKEERQADDERRVGAVHDRRELGAELVQGREKERVGDRDPDHAAREKPEQPTGVEGREERFAERGQGREEKQNGQGVFEQVHGGGVDLFSDDPKEDDGDGPEERGADREDFAELGEVLGGAENVGHEALLITEEGKVVKFAGDCRRVIL